MCNMDEFFDQRAESLMIVHLTRRDDLRVKRVISPKAAGDFLVEIAQDGEWTSRVFGLRVRGLEHPVASPNALDDHLGELPLIDVSDASFPYAMIVFTSDDERGYFRWVREPVVTRGGARLKTVREARWRELDRDSLAEIVAAVNAWYEAQRQAQAA